MPRKLIEMQAKLYNTPHLIDAETFNWVEGIVAAQDNPAVKRLGVLQDKKSNKKSIDNMQYNADTGVGIIEVSGPLTYVEYEAVCGEANASYQGIESQFDTMAKAGAKTIVLAVDSPGGEAYGMMETGRYLRSQADAKGIKLIAYVDGLAASAGMGLASSAHEIIANPSSELGSVGVVVKLRNINEAMTKMGVQDTYIYAGANKIPFKADGSFSEVFLEDIQKKVDALYEQFASYVADMRGVSVEAVKNTEAKVFMAQEAVDIGFADKLMTREEFFTYLADQGTYKAPQGNNMLNKLFKSQEEKAEMVKLEEVQAALTELSGKHEATLTQLADLTVALEAKGAELKDALDKVAAFEAEATAAKLAAEEAKKNARKERLAAVMGDEKAVELSASLESLDDAAFDTVAKAYEAQAAASAASEMFKEVGADAEKNLDASDDDATMRLVQEKYGRKA